MSNEAAERLKDWLDVPLILKLDEALATERRATVERIRERLLTPKGYSRDVDIFEVLRDVESAR